MITKLMSKYKDIQRNEEKKDTDTSTTTSSTSTSNSSNSSTFQFLSEKFQERQLQHEQIEKEREETENNEFQQLGLLFIIIDDLPHELIWRVWLNSIEDENRVKVFIHAKNPDKVQSQWVKSHLVDFCFRPQWGSVEITKAMIELMRKVNFLLFV